MKKLRREQVVIDYDFQNEHNDWVDRLIALGEFLHGTCVNKNEEVHIVAHEDRHIGGLRMTEVSFISNGGMSGSSYMNGDPSGKLVLAYCESFLSTYGEPPFRPGGWDSCVNLHGEAKVGLLEAMGLSSEDEYLKQIAEEASV